MDVSEWAIVAQSCVAGATLILASFAFLSIRQTRQIQSQQRKEQQLKEIADWAVEVMRAPFKAEIAVYPHEMVTYEEPAKKQIFEDLYAIANYRIKRELDLVGAQGTYIRHIAENIDTELYRKISHTIEQIDYLVQKIDEIGFAQAKDIYMHPLLEAASKVLKHVSELMHKDDTSTSSDKSRENTTIAALTITIGLVAIVLATQFVEIEKNVAIAVLCYVVGLGGMLYGFYRYYKSR